MRKKTLLFIILLVISITPSLRAQVSFGSPEKINDHWKFILGDVQDGQSVGLDDTRWQQVSLPHDWSVKGQLSPTLASATGYLPGGIGWYRKTIDIPADKQGQKVYLYFEGVYNRSELFMNGQSLGKRPNGYISFMVDATPYIQYGQENMIAVRVDHSQYADSRWYTGSGIYRDVWVIYANPVHIAQWGIYAYPEETKNGYHLNVEVEINNEEESNTPLTVVNELYSAEGKLVAKDAKKLTAKPGNGNKLTTSLKVNRPALWSLSDPNLYELKTTVLKGGIETDQATTRTGFRTYTFDPNQGFALNGEWMKVKGVCIHHDAGVLGAAVPREVWKRRLQTLKEIGVNAIRTSHNPQATDLYELCDEMGVLVLNEMYDEWVFPKRKWIEGWNVGTSGFQGSYDIFKEWGEVDLADLVRRDRNHLSVFAWSIGNEVDYPNDPYSHPVLGGEKAGFTQASYGGYNPDAPDAMELGDIAKRLVSVVKEYDRSRPVTAGLAGVAMSNETEYPAALDIAGYNYTEDKYDSDHERYPNRVIYGSENRHDMAAWKATRDRKHIFGQFLWTGIDYLGESGRWPSRGFYSGLLDFGGFIKPRGYFRQSLWSDKPMAYLGTYPTPGRESRNQSRDVLSQSENGDVSNYVERAPSMDAWPVWNYYEGQSIRVVCYTNADKAKLLLNGVEVGETKEYDDNTGIIFWDIPYQSGKLEVVGLDKNDKTVSGYTIQSSKRPHALQIVQAEKQIDKEQGLAQIVVQVVDEEGVPVILSDDEVTCRITGPAKLLGLEASNNSDMTDYTDNRHRMFHGHILAYVQATGEQGEIKINFTSPWLEPAEITVNAATCNTTQEDSDSNQTSDITVNTVTEKGAWCWFADPRAVSHENESGTIKNSYIGYIDVQGNIKATQIDHLRNRMDEVLIRSWFQPDDHNNPTFLVLPDDRVMIFYSRHTDEPCFYYRISRKPGDITTLGKEIRLETADNTTYPSPFILSDDPDHIYLCWRGIGWHPTIARLTMPDKEDKVNFDWGPYQIVQSQKGGRGVRPYAKYMSNGKDRIYLAYTTTHPDNQSVNYIYFNYIDINTHELKDIKGQKLAEVGNGILHNVEATADYKNSYPVAVAEDSPYRNWLWEISVTDEKRPVIAVVRISEDKNSHEYYQVRWTGTEWRKTFLSHAGGHFHQTPDLEKCYSGGMAIDKADPSIIYGSVPVEGKHGSVYELKKFAVTPEGTLASTEQLTYNSHKNNIRPFVISNEGANPQMVWMNGDYYDWIVSSARPGYSTAIRTNMDIPSDEIDIDKGLLHQNPGGTASSVDLKVIDIPQSDKFTIHATIAVDHDAYYGEIIKTDAFVYGLKGGEQPKPYIKAGDNEMTSSNVLGNSDAWKTQNRGTGGHWHAPVKPESFQLTITYEDGVLRIYIDGLVDQYAEAEGLSLSQVVPGGFKGTMQNIRIYNRALSQGEIKTLWQLHDSTITSQ